MNQKQWKPLPLQHMKGGSIKRWIPEAIENYLTVILMFSSILLLLVLQFFWLQKVYKDESSSFQKETSMMFRNMVFDMNDSLIDQSIHRIPGDSGRIEFLKSHGGNDTLRMIERHATRREYFNLEDSSARVQVFISSDSDHDSLERILRPLVSKIKQNHGPQTFAIKISLDSLKIADIENKFSKLLGSAGINLPFRVQCIQKPGPTPPDTRLIKSSSPEQVIFTPAGDYFLDFPDQHWVILQKMSPQILFSVFLTLLTISSFYMMHRTSKMQQRLMGLKNDFISNVTHELKSPIATVSVAIEALRNFKGLDNPKLTTEYLDIAQNELNRLTLLTDKVLRTAVFENTGVEFKSGQIDAERLVTQVLNSLKLVLEKNQTVVTLEKEGNDFVVWGGADHLANVVYNLLDNALKYSQPGAGITVRLISFPNRVSISVKDHGIGIPAEYQKKIFEKFFRVPTGDVHNIKGYGLGLSYVASVIRSHGGTIEVESEPGKGSCFTMTLARTF